MLLQVKSATLARGKVPILSNISFEASAGEWIVLVGRNGSGKSTLLDALAGVSQPVAGEIGYRAPAGATDVRRTYLPQAPERLLIATSAADEFAASLRMPSADLRRGWGEWVVPQLAPFGLGHLQPDDLPSRMSTGMQRKFVYAMALARPGEVLLCDEPTSGLDAPSRAELLAEIARFVQQGGLAITALHDLDEALFSATRVLALAHGRLVFDGTPQAFAESAASLERDGVPLPPSVRLALAIASAGGPKPGLCRPEDLAARLLASPAVQDGARCSEEALGQEAGPVPAAAAASSELASAAMEMPPPEAGAESRVGAFHPALRWLSLTAITIAIALVHRPAGDLVAVLATLALLAALRAPLRTSLRLTWTWVSFAALACAVSGLQLGPPFHTRWAFHAATAKHTLLEVVPYWCFLQIGQLALARFSSLQFAALVEATLARIVPRRQRLVASWFGALVTRFIPAVEVIYREQWYAYRVRLQNAGRLLSTSRVLVDVANVIAPFVIRMLRFGEATADAMEARRLFEVPPPSALLPGWRVRGRDLAVMAMALVSIALLVWTH
ncbi:ATP-binding cassette domain-containing protein [Alicyclobacillus mali (ex Roth et al. 2021)]|uniref:ATP-binding cassette domain-containing protein n=1 Tax=Alicyclobacillus mali (ex Roth et al. 2021) TaxID=1123961 RepID=UPI001E3999E1|nr:ATP-binding cassette domain-containing protein [Alicyclobacillus mali (ex Roth et al. 2021)]